MILSQNRNNDWVWETTVGEQLSPYFLTRAAAWGWRDLIFDQVKQEIVGNTFAHEVHTEEECTCENCGCK